MNRIIIIGNGFDLAHNLKTSYKNFIDYYWNILSRQLFDSYAERHKQSFRLIFLPNFYENDFVSLEKKNREGELVEDFFNEDGDSSFCNFCRLITKHNGSKHKPAIYLKFKNRFFGHISNHCSLINWVDIENEYYNVLKRLCVEENPQERSEKVKTLNREFNAVKKLLEEYLQEISEKPVNQHESIKVAVDSLIELDDVALRKTHQYLDSIFNEIQQLGDTPDFFEEMEKDISYTLCSVVEAKRLHLKKKLENDHFKNEFCKPTQTIYLNFNYTNTFQKIYFDKESGDEIINIHGELNNKANPMIFGYGDELDHEYKKIEGLQDNDFLENIKSINYHKTRNYRKLLEYIESDLYQVFVMGHSCGNSDRTLLNTLFEHDNCAAIKVYYWQQENGLDNYSDLIKNISRNFNDKPRMRDIVVNRENCSPLIPVSKV